MSGLNEQYFRMEPVNDVDPGFCSTAPLEPKPLPEHSRFRLTEVETGEQQRVRPTTFNALAEQ
jgi:hypothetical protein